VALLLFLRPVFDKRMLHAMEPAEVEEESSGSRICFLDR